jgi:hypothetical protein
MKVRYILTIALAILFLILAVIPARANIAPPQTDLGKNIDPGGSDQTKVQMMKETVRMEVRLNPGDRSPLQVGDFLMDKAKYRVYVKASFTMRNQGSETERINVRFPISIYFGSNMVESETKSYYEMFKIKVDDYSVQDLTAEVNGIPVKTTRQSIILQNCEYNCLHNWMTFDATFPPGKDVNIVVNYWQFPDGVYPVAQVGYIVSTGAGWYGQIGSADIILRLPYPVDLRNVQLARPALEGKITGSEIDWHLNQFEPSGDDDFYILLVDPRLWIDYLHAQTIAQSSPNNGSAWSELANLCDIATQDREWGYPISDSPNLISLLETCKVYYEKAIQLQPENLNLRANYVKLDFRYLVSVGLLFEHSEPLPVKQLEQEIDYVLSHDPGNSEVILVQQWLNYYLTPYPAYPYTPVTTMRPSATESKVIMFKNTPISENAITHAAVQPTLTLTSSPMNQSKSESALVIVFTAVLVLLISVGFLVKSKINS